MKIITLALLSTACLQGSASLLFVSPTVSANGRVVTSTLSGCSSPLSPSTGITNVQVYSPYTGGFLDVASVTSSGCVVTINMGQIPIANNIAAPQVVVTVGSNLTDASANTVTGQVTNINVSGSEWYIPGVAPYLTSSMNEGFWTDPSASKGAIGFLSTGLCSRANITTTNFDINVFQYGGVVAHHFVLYQGGPPGQAGASLVHDWGLTSNLTVYGDMGLVTGISGAREYDICDIASDAQYTSIAMVRVSGSFSGTPPARRPIVACVGDSLRSYQGLTDTRKSDCSQAAAAFGFATLHIGSAGLRVGGAPGNDMVSLYPPVINKLDAAEVLSIVDMGWSSGLNDIQLDAVSPTTLGTRWTNFLSAMYGATHWFSNVIILGIPPESAFGSTPATYDPSISSAVAAFTSPTPRFIRTGSGGAVWLNNTISDGSCTLAGGDKQSDNLHIQGCDPGTWVGYSKVAARKIPIYDGILNGHSYSVSCPPTGLVGVALTCTVTLHTGAVFIGDQTYTPASSGGTMSPSGAITPALGATGSTFMFTPTSSGSKTISFTNGQDGWINPSSASITVSLSSTPTWMVP